MGELRHRLLAIIDDPSSGLDDERPELRRLAAALGADTNLGLSDPEPTVRAAAAERARNGTDALLEAGEDDSAEVREAIAFALGEIGASGAVPWLEEKAAGDSDEAVREAAVAALGALASNSTVPLLVELSRSAPPKIRRRAVVALSAFDSEEALTAIHDAAADRNPMVREVAEMVVGPAPEDLPWPK